MKVIHVLRKPLSEGTVAKNVLKHGTGALNIDASRIGMSAKDSAALKAKASQNPQPRQGLAGDDRSDVAAGMFGERALGVAVKPHAGGRWPANVILQHLVGCDESCTPGCPVTALDEQSGVTSSNAMGGAGQYTGGYTGRSYGGGTLGRFHSDTGGASRFFKQVKP